VVNVELLHDSGDRSIRYGGDTRTWMVSDSGSALVTVAERPGGATAEVAGVEARAGCFDAETTIAFQ